MEKHFLKTGWRVQSVINSNLLLSWSSTGFDSTTRSVQVKTGFFMLMNDLLSAICCSFLERKNRLALCLFCLKPSNLQRVECLKFSDYDWLALLDTSLFSALIGLRVMTMFILKELDARLTMWLRANFPSGHWRYCRNKILENYPNRVWCHNISDAFLALGELFR